MSVENVKKFYEDIEKDENLREKLEKLQDEFNLSEKEATEEEVAAEIVAIAGKLGYHFSEDEFKEHFSKLELSDDSLEDAAGGKLSWKTFGKAVGIGVGAFVVANAAKETYDGYKSIKKVEGYIDNRWGGR